MMAGRPERRVRRTTLTKARDDLAHLLAHFAVLYRTGAVLVNTTPTGHSHGGWMLLVYTVAGPLAWPIRNEDLSLFDRVARMDLADPRANDVTAAADGRNTRLADLTCAAWGGASGLATFNPTTTTSRGRDT